MDTSENNSPSVSIIIPAFNVEKWVEESIKSALVQSYPNLEVVVVDDGSTDETWSIIQRLAELDARVHPIRQENQGPSAARNHGIQVSRGSLLLFLDADDWIHPDTVADAIELFRKFQLDVVMIQCAKYFDQSNAWSTGTDDFYWRLPTVRSADARKALEIPEALIFYPLAQLKIVSKTFLVESGLTFLEGIRYEDNPFHISLLCSNPRCALLSKRYYAWRQGRPGQFTGTAHVADCHIALDNMLKSATELGPNIFPFLLISVTRLICTVAYCVRTDFERQQFIEASTRMVREAIAPTRLETALGWILTSGTIHPGDRVLASALFAFPVLLTAALGSGKNRYWASVKMVVFASKAENTITSLRILVKLISSIRLLVNYSRGVGESKVTGLG